MIQKSKIKRELKGSFTVEAAIVLPIILYVLLLIVYGAFYAYSSYTLSLNAYISVFRGSRTNLLKENAYQTTEESMKIFIQKELPAVTGIQYEIQSNLQRNDIEVEAKIQIPFMQSIMQAVWPVRISRYAKRTDPVFFLRNCRKVETLYKERRDI